MLSPTLRKMLTEEKSMPFLESHWKSSLFHSIIVYLLFFAILAVLKFILII